MRTTHRIAVQQAAPDLVARNFSSEMPDTLWVADITYVRSGEGFVYLAFILDACSRRVVGWSMATHLRTELVVDALQMAIARRKPAPGLVHHSDRGVQYTSLSFGKRLEDEELLPSMGRVGCAYDNALAESFLATLKTAGASLSQHLAHQASGQDGDLRVHRGLLQHPQEAFRSRAFEPC